MQVLMQWQWPALREQDHCLTAAAIGTVSTRCYSRQEVCGITYSAMGIIHDVEAVSGMLVGRKGG